MRRLRREYHARKRAGLRSWHWHPAVRATTCGVALAIGLAIGWALADMIAAGAVDGLKH